MPEIAGTMPDPKSRARVSALRKAAVPTMPSLEEQKKKAAPVLEGWRAWLPVAVGVALGLLQIVQPLRVEGADVGEIAGGSDIHLRVTHPAEPLVTLRAIGGDIQKIALLPPERI